MKNIAVIKLGGSALQNDGTLEQLGLLIRGYQKKRYNVVVVHGGGPAINQELLKQNISWKFINGQRQTTPAMMEIIDKVLANEVNSVLVNSLKSKKVNAIGLSGFADKILFCSAVSKELQQVGKIHTVDSSQISALFRRFGFFVPVIAPLGIGANNEKYNINADWAASKIAIQLNAKKLIFLTDQYGILDENRNLISQVNAQIINKMIDDGVIHGGMNTKVQAMMTAYQEGIKQVQVLNANQAALFLENPKTGTLVTKNEVCHGKAG